MYINRSTAIWLAGSAPSSSPSNTQKERPLAAAGISLPESSRAQPSPPRASSAPPLSPSPGPPIEHQAFKMASPPSLAQKVEDPKPEDEEKTEQQKRMDLYYGIITAGLTAFVWKDALQMLDRVSKSDATLAPFAAVYLCAAATAMILGMVACKFPMSAPCSMGVAGHGAFHALLFMVLGLHADTFVYHANYILAIGCACVAGFLLTMYWGHSTEDPMVISVCAKYIASAASWLWTYLCSLYGYLRNKLRTPAATDDTANQTERTARLLDDGDLPRDV